jgi:hypothetical protein
MVFTKASSSATACSKEDGTAWALSTGIVLDLLGLIVLRRVVQSLPFYCDFAQRRKVFGRNAD